MGTQYGPILYRQVGGSQKHYLGERVQVAKMISGGRIMGATDTLHGSIAVHAHTVLNANADAVRAAKNETFETYVMSHTGIGDSEMSR